MSIPIVKKIHTQEDQKLVINAVREDGETFAFPTHAVIKDEEIVGALSLNAIPLAAIWTKSDTIKAKDSYILNHTLSSIANDRGIERYLIGCDESSPYLKYMEKFGYTPFWKTNLFLSQ